MNKPPIGILSGTFDPIHLGHIHLATTIYKNCDLQKILLIPCYQSPFKNLPIASTKDRLNMIRLATKDLPYLEMEDYETKKPTISYTKNTLEYLTEKNNESPLALIMGMDVFDKFDEWSEWQKILDLSHLIIVDRKNHPQATNKKVMEILAKREISDPKQLQNKKSGLIYTTDINPLPITATEIRELIEQGEDTNHLLNKDVWQYINSNKIYGSPIKT